MDEYGLRNANMSWITSDSNQFCDCLFKLVKDSKLALGFIFEWIQPQFWNHIF